MSELPEGWASARLNDVCELINGRAYKQSELLDSGRYPVLRVGNFFSNRGWYYSDLELEADKYCDRGDLLYAWSASFGPRIWEGEKSIFHYHIWNTRLNDLAVEKRFLYYWFEWDKENIQAEHGTGSTMIHVTKGDMEARALELPPLPEQRRIVAKIDSLTDKSRRTRDRLDHIPRLVEKYKQAVLAAAFKGELTRAWRAERGVVALYQTAFIADVITDIRYGTAKKCGYGAGATPVLRIPNVQRGEITVDDLKSADFDDAELRKLQLLEGDLLVIRSNGSLGLVGRCAVVNKAAAGMLFAGYLIRLRLDTVIVSPRFAHLWLQSAPMRSVIEGLAKSTSGVNNINSTQIGQLPIKLPRPDEQAEIVRRIDAAFIWIDRLASEATSARRLIDRLDQAVLAKAFRGELVPQNPEDEPASVLLDRIRSERGAAPKTRRGRKAKVA